MGAGSRRKGKRGELEACHALTELTGREWRRSAIQSRGGGAEAPDIVCGDLPRSHCEVKRGKAIGLWAALRQAERDASGDQLPWVLARRDREEWVVLVRLRDVVELGEMLGGEE